MRVHIRRWLARSLKALAIGSLFLVALLGVGLLWPIKSAPVLRTTTATVISGAHIVDVASGSTKDGLNVVVQGGRVIAVGPPAEVVPPAGSQVVDGSGRYLIPGFWDMHVHTESSRIDAPGA